MTKFSVFGEGDDDDDEPFVVSAPEPATKRRRRSSGAGSPSSASQSTREGSVLPAESTGVFAGDEKENTDVAEAPTGGQISVILSNPDVLDCSICFDPLTIPVYQCSNGHIACSSCCTKLRNRCPSCCEKIGHIRCRAIESVLESVKISCPYKSYGCQAKVSYCSKLSHEESCVFAPFACPFPDCIFRGSPTNLPWHLNQKHTRSVISFRFNSICPVNVKMDDKLLILQEEKDGILFILDIKNTNSMAIRSIGCTYSGDNRFVYALVVRKGSSSLRFQSVTEKASQVLDDFPSVDFLQAPGYFFNSSGCLRLEICIWSKGASLSDTGRALIHGAEFGNNS